MKNKTIAILGSKGSFHEAAANKYFGEEVTYIYCPTFGEVFASLKKGVVDFGITAIENTVAGTILPNYAMMRESELKIVGEVYLPIQQNLLSLHGQTIADLKEVHSHPMALLQCSKFCEQYPHIKLVEASDTATSAKRIAEEHLLNVGAIASTYVANLYGLQVLKEGIETHKKNFTRFLIIADALKNTDTNKPVNKASICFNVVHEKGSLAKVLMLLANNNINLTKIQSLPLVGKEWEYYIHIDMEFNDFNNYKNALLLIKPSLNEFKILGEYSCGEKTSISISNAERSINHSEPIIT